tara:strand:+ start:608 stop:712 length:105 start_codon:yes stop_codon:yes gene_type:complete
MGVCCCKDEGLALVDAADEFVFGIRYGTLIGIAM